MNLVNFVNQTPPCQTAAHPRRKILSEESSGSKISIITAMERFVSAVDNMDKVVMIPCKLMDMSVPTKDETVPSSIRSESDLHRVYLMLISLRKELNDVSTERSSDIMSASSIHRRKKSALTKRSNSKDGNVQVKNAVSSLSLSSLESVSSDVSEFENDTDSDSGKQSDSDTSTEQSEQLSPKLSNKPLPHVSLADTFRLHLTGLYSTLDELTSSANYLSNRYQSEVGFW